MPQKTVFIRDGDLDKWNAIERKSEFIHNALNPLVFPGDPKTDTSKMTLPKPIKTTKEEPFKTYFKKGKK